jgi:transcriptional regulator with XRE-family HTH domain
VNKKTKPRPTTPLTISDQLRAIIVDSGKTAYAVGKLADVDPGVVQRFLTGERDLRVATLDKLAAALGLRLCQDQDDSKGDE